MLVKRIEADNTALARELASAMEYNPELRAQLKQAIDQNSATIFNTSTTSINQSFELFDKLMPLMDAIITSRIKEYINQRLIVIAKEMNKNLLNIHTLAESNASGTAETTAAGTEMAQSWHGSLPSSGAGESVQD